MICSGWSCLCPLKGADQRLERWLNPMESTNLGIDLISTPLEGCWIFCSLWELGYCCSLLRYLSQPNLVTSCGLEGERPQATSLVTLHILVRSDVTVSGSRGRHRREKSGRQVLLHLPASDGVGSQCDHGVLAMSISIRVWLSQGDGYSPKGP